MSCLTVPMREPFLYSLIWMATTSTSGPIGVTVRTPVIGSNDIGVLLLIGFNESRGELY